MKRRFGFLKRIASLLIVLVLLAALAAVPAGALNGNGFTVEKLTFRDVLRLYTMNKSSFGADAMATDAYGISNGAKRLAELFGYTVGLNYTGQGLNAHYFGKDITDKMGAEPYTDGGLLGTYEVEITPYRGSALALPLGKTTAIRVYLAGYTNAASGVAPVLHYVWQDGGRWYAVKDDSPYYKVSYNGRSATQLGGTGLVMAQAKASGGTENITGWTSLSDAEDGGGVVHLDGGTLVAGQGTASVFGLTRDMSKLRTEGGRSSSLVALSDYVQGDTTFQTGPLVFSRECYELATMRRIPDGDPLREDISYRFRVVYDEALTLAPGASRNDAGLTVRSQVTGGSYAVEDFVWYGSNKYFTSDKYNPHVVEFTYTPSTEGQGICTLAPVNLVGSESSLKAAVFYANVETVSAELPAAPEPTAAPAAAAQAPAATPAPAVQTPAATPFVTSTPVPPLTTPTATLSQLFNAPDGAPLTRGTLAMTLWILSGQPSGDTARLFLDLPADPTAARAISWAVRTNVIEGYSDGTFHPDYIVTREQGAVIMSRYAALRGVSLGSDGAKLAEAPDEESVMPSARNAVAWALDRGLLHPLADGRLAPHDSLLCGDAIVMIRTLQQML